MDNNKKLIRTADNTVIAGVCGSIADYFGFNAKIVRIVYAALTLFTAGFPGVLLYLFLMLIIPKQAALGTGETSIEKKE